MKYVLIILLLFLLLLFGCVEQEFECPSAGETLNCAGVDEAQNPPHPDSRCYGEGLDWAVLNCPDLMIVE